MFEKIFGKRSAVTFESDRLWKTSSLKLEGIAKHIASLDRNSRVLLVAHFRETFRALESLLQANAVSYTPLTTAVEGSQLLLKDRYQPGKLFLATSDALPVQQQRQPGTECDFQIAIIVAEHYPLPAGDDRIRDFAAGLPCPARVCFHDSLDCALMKYFGGDNLLKIMTMLKAPDNEAISHSMVDKAVRSIQEKLAKLASVDHKADSQDQWFQYNVTYKS